jgi:hypothetical protein
VKPALKTRSEEKRTSLMVVDIVVGEVRRLYEIREGMVILYDREKGKDGATRCRDDGCG